MKAKVNHESSIYKKIQKVLASVFVMLFCFYSLHLSVLLSSIVVAQGESPDNIQEESQEQNQEESSDEDTETEPAITESTAEEPIDVIPDSPPPIEEIKPVEIIEEPVIEEGENEETIDPVLPPATTVPSGDQNSDSPDSLVEPSEPETEPSA